MTTKIMPISDLRKNTSSVIRSLKNSDDVVYITQHGRPTAVLIEYEAYEELIADKQKVDENGWPEGFFETFFGAIQDDSFKRHSQGEYEEREPIE